MQEEIGEVDGVGTAVGLVSQQQVLTRRRSSGEKANRMLVSKLIPLVHVCGSAHSCDCVGQFQLRAAY